MLIAYDEEPERIKDCNDFILILTNYYDIAGEQLFESYYDDLLENDYELRVAAARLLGRNMKIIINKNETLRNKILMILEEKVKRFTTNDIDQMYKVREHGDKQVEQMKLISETIKGIKDSNAQFYERPN